MLKNKTSLNNLKKSKNVYVNFYKDLESVLEQIPEGNRKKGNFQSASLNRGYTFYYKGRNFSAY